MSKFDIRPHFECKNSIFGLSSNVKIGFRMSKCDFSARIRMSKKEKPKTKNEKQTNFSFNSISKNEKRKTKQLQLAKKKKSLILIFLIFKKLGRDGR